MSMLAHTQGRVSRTTGSLNDKPRKKTRGSPKSSMSSVQMMPKLRGVTSTSTSIRLPGKKVTPSGPKFVSTLTSSRCRTYMQHHRGAPGAPTWNIAAAAAQEIQASGITSRQRAIAFNSQESSTAADSAQTTKSSHCCASQQHHTRPVQLHLRLLLSDLTPEVHLTHDSM